MLSFSSAKPSWFSDCCVDSAYAAHCARLFLSLLLCLANADCMYADCVVGASDLLEIEVGALLRWIRNGLERCLHS